MSRSRSLVFTSLVLSGVALFAAPPPLALNDNPALWKEYGLVHTSTGERGKVAYSVYEFKDLTDALAAWEWQRSPQGQPCEQAPFCTQDAGRTLVADDNYLVIFDSPKPAKAEVDAVIAGLPDKQDTSLPAILTFLPRQDLAPDSARYVLGPESLQAFAPELASGKPGFDQGAEAQVAQYRLPNTSDPVRLALFYYPTSDIARLHAAQFKHVPGTFVKRSGVLVALVYGGATQVQADTLLSRVEYEAKITFNDTPPPPPIKPLFELLRNILYLSMLVAALGAAAGVLYGGMRVYRRRYGNLDDQEAMTTLHLSGD